MKQTKSERGAQLWLSNVLIRAAAQHGSPPGETTPPFLRVCSINRSCFTTMEANANHHVRRLSSLAFNTLDAENEQQKQWTRDLLQPNLPRLLRPSQLKKYSNNRLVMDLRVYFRYFAALHVSGVYPSSPNDHGAADQSGPGPRTPLR